MNKYLKKNKKGMGKTAWWVKVLAAKSSGLSAHVPQHTCALPPDICTYRQMDVKGKEPKHAK